MLSKEEIRDLPIIWVYKIASNNGKKIIFVQSREYYDDFSKKLHGFYCIRCVGGYKLGGVYTEF